MGDGARCWLQTRSRAWDPTQKLLHNAVGSGARGLLAGTGVAASALASVSGIASGCSSTGTVSGLTGLAHHPIHLRTTSAAVAARRITTACASSSAAVAAAAAASTSPAAPSLPTRHIVAAVDPDLAGALAVIFWDADPDADPDSSGPTTTSLLTPHPADPHGPRPPGADGGAADGPGGGVTGVWLPVPPPPPADRSRWSVGVWDMPVSAAERQKKTLGGGVSRRRLLHVAGARAVLSQALAAALPPPGEPRRVALYGYVEVPPILPGDGSFSAYTSLWSTGAWLGLLTGMGFTVGSTPVRRWKTDLGLYGARSKEAGMQLARVLFPGQQPILRLKKDHGRADALLIAAWALGASLPPRLAATLRRNHQDLASLLEQETAAGRPAPSLQWGPPRPPAPTDAYGSLLTPERDMMDEIEAAHAKVQRVEDARAQRRAAKDEEAAARAARKAARAAKSKSKSASTSRAGGAAEAGEGEGQAAAPKVARRRRAAAAPTEGGDAETGAEAGAEAAAAGVEGAKRRARRKKAAAESEASGEAEPAGGAAGVAPAATGDAAPSTPARSPMRRTKTGAAPAVPGAEVGGVAETGEASGQQAASVGGVDGEAAGKAPAKARRRRAGAAAVQGAAPAGAEQQDVA
ncbi:hypothetical protein HYH03_001918 [Edaphochlamys debaryana]|uniref:Uncharacterized protein n=1 Tax=Edaphochlamys debaryana TaxID=47281 RepID=A0A835YCU1_9CHLO|nr:hypothetical protein HYH03_001918 [Edaphochlamys debaryana]|eukprot:KAG2500343.1 hypothetical protein HYH03_001918 [Edaphochlamys debaryana]